MAKTQAKMQAELTKCDAKIKAQDQLIQRLLQELGYTCAGKRNSFFFFLVASKKQKKEKKSVYFFLLTIVVSLFIFSRWFISKNRTQRAQRRCDERRGKVKDALVCQHQSPATQEWKATDATTAATCAFVANTTTNRASPASILQFTASTAVVGITARSPPLTSDGRLSSTSRGCLDDTSFLAGIIGAFLLKHTVHPSIVCVALWRKRLSPSTDVSRP